LWFLIGNFAKTVVATLWPEVLAMAYNITMMHFWQEAFCCIFWQQIAITFLPITNAASRLGATG